LLGPTQLWGAALQAISPSLSPSPPPQRSSSSLPCNETRPRSPSPVATSRLPSSRQQSTFGLQSDAGDILDMECDSPFRSEKKGEEFHLQNKAPDDVSPTQPWNDPSR